MAILRSTPLFDGPTSDRASLLRTLTHGVTNESPLWDVIIVGGGATGLGAAVDAANRGYRTLLLEQSDFAKGTSSRSTKLVHGGVRYLAQGNIPLVFEALRERGILRRNAPHLVKDCVFVIPSYSLFDTIRFTLGLGLYDLLAGHRRFGSSKPLGVRQTLRRLPTIRREGLKGGILYHDGQFDDARLAVNLAQTCLEQGGVALNHMAVTGLIHADGRLTGVHTKDQETGNTYTIRGRVVVNATGVFVDEILSMDRPDHPRLVMPSQGAHIVLDAHFLPGDEALMIPKTSDGRVLFAVPWYGHLIVGTTDTPLDRHDLEPRPLQEEIDFILETARAYLTEAPTRADIQSVFAGLRPLAAPQNEGDGGEVQTKEISRGHRILVETSGLVSIIGGKWTTYRDMAEDLIDTAMKVGGLPARTCGTRSLGVHGSGGIDLERATAWSHPHHAFDPLSVYGSDAPALAHLIATEEGADVLLVEGHPYVEGQVIWAVRHEMARTLEDVLARRIRLLFLDAGAAIKAAPRTAELMAGELERDGTWVRRQVESFTSLARQYLPSSEQSK